MFVLDLYAVRQRQLESRESELRLLTGFRARLFWACLEVPRARRRRTTRHDAGRGVPRPQGSSFNQNLIALPMSRGNESGQQLGSETVVYDKSDLERLRALDKRIPTLLVLKGADTGLRIAIKNNRVSLGRTIDADIVLNDSLISQCHAEIICDWETGTYTVIDLDSTNGTFVNDRAIDRREVTDGDKIFLGSTILKFTLEDQVESESGQLFDKLMFEDDLTGLVVRRRFDNDLRVHLQSAKALAKPISLLMMDLDGLKQINDTHGHPVGAAVISGAGKLIGGICNQLGQACRYGGDEFIAYLLEVNKDDAVKVAASICEAVRNHAFQKDDLRLKVSISIGAATFPADGMTAEAVAHAADEALYRAKKNGRDGVST